MFQHTSARLRPGSASTAARSIWLIGAGAPGRRAAAPASQSQSTPRESLPLRYRNPEPGRRMLPVSAGSIAMARMTLPPRGWRCSPWPIQSSDGPRPYARATCSIRLAGTPVCSSPQAGVQALEQGLELVVAEHVLVARTRRRRDRRGGSRAPARTRARHRCRGAAGGTRPPAPPVGVRIGSITITWPGASRSQWSWACGALARRIRAPHDDAGGVGRSLGVEAVLARSVDVRRARRDRRCCRPCPARPRSPRGG